MICAMSPGDRSPSRFRWACSPRRTPTEPVEYVTSHREATAVSSTPKKGPRTMKPWHGVLVATATPYDDQLQHRPRRLRRAHRLARGERLRRASTPNGSLGEYQVLTDDERAAVVRDRGRGRARRRSASCPASPRTARAEARALGRAGRRGRVPRRSCCCRRTPTAPTTRRSSPHYAEVAEVGLPIVAYNNPIDTKVDLTPGAAAPSCTSEGHIVGGQGVHRRRAPRLPRSPSSRPELDLLIGADDVLLELALAGAHGLDRRLPERLPGGLRRALRRRCRRPAT